MNPRWYSMKTREAEIVVGGAGNQFMVLVTNCDFNLHIRCADLPFTIESEVHNHPLTPFWKFEKFTCNLCGKEGSNVKVDTDYGLYYCSRCDFVAHLDCAIDSRNREELKDEESTEQSVDSAAYEVKKHNVGKDGTKIATEIKHFSHEHDLKLRDEVQNNKICDRCATLPLIARYEQHEHPFTLCYTTEDDCGEYYRDISEEE
uniref:DC1 domain-containing protein n=1 Tax=Fagus sylvatica TaxID=28930 RepID=A0A2N9H754_FAGSY